MYITDEEYKDYTEGMTGATAFEREALRDGYFRRYGKFFSIDNFNPKYYKELFIMICRRIHGTKRKAIDRQFLESVLTLDDNIYFQIVHAVIDDLLEKEYLHAKRINGRTYLELTDKAFTKLESMNIKLKNQ